MEKPADLGWKQFFAAVVESLRWPVAFVVIALLLRVPLERLIDAISAALRS